MDYYRSLRLLMLVLALLSLSKFSFTQSHKAIHKDTIYASVNPMISIDSSKEQNIVAYPNTSQRLYIRETPSENRYLMVYLNDLKFQSSQNGTDKFYVDISEIKTGKGLKSAQTGKIIFEQGSSNQLVFKITGKGMGSVEIFIRVEGENLQTGIVKQLNFKYAIIDEKEFNKKYRRQSREKNYNSDTISLEYEKFSFNPYISDLDLLKINNDVERELNDVKGKLQDIEVEKDNLKVKLNDIEGKLNSLTMAKNDFRVKHNDFKRQSNSLRRKFNDINERKDNERYKIYFTIGLSGLGTLLIFFVIIFKRNIFRVDYKYINVKKINDFRDMLAEGKEIRDILEEVRKYLKNGRFNIYQNQVIALQRQYMNLKNSSIHGSISQQDKGVQLNEITKNILIVFDALEKELRQSRSI